MIISGVYKIQSILKPDRCYIGSSADITKRWKGHLTGLKTHKHPNSKIQRHYDKYGKDDLVFSILVSCDKNDMIAHEQFFIDSYKPWFNLRPKAENNLGMVTTEATKKKLSIALRGRPAHNKGKPAYNKGKPMTEEQKIKLRVSRKLQVMKPVSEETREKIRLANKRRTYSSLSQEAKNKISNSNKGRPVSEETRLKISLSQKGKKRPWQEGEKHHNYGKTHSPETIIKLKEARKRQGNPFKGRKHSEETKQRLRLANLGKRQSEETIKKRKETCLIKKLKVA